MENIPWYFQYKRSYWFPDSGYLSINSVLTKKKVLGVLLMVRGSWVLRICALEELMKWCRYECVCMCSRKEELSSNSQKNNRSIISSCDKLTLGSRAAVLKHALTDVNYLVAEPSIGSQVPEWQQPVSVGDNKAEGDPDKHTECTWCGPPLTVTTD